MGNKVIRPVIKVVLIDLNIVSESRVLFECFYQNFFLHYDKESKAGALNERVRHFKIIPH